MPSSCGSVILTSILSPSTAFLGILIVAVVLNSSPSAAESFLLIVFELCASSKITSGAFTCSKLAETSGSFIYVSCLPGFMFVILALIVVSCPCLRSNPGTLNEYWLKLSFVNGKFCPPLPISVIPVITPLSSICIANFLSYGAFPGSFI